MRLLAAPAAALLLVGAVACSSDSGSSSRGPVVVQVSGEAEELSVYEALINAYEKSRDTEVKLVGIADKDDHLAKLTTSFATGNPPDVFLVNFREYTQYVARGAVDPIGPRLEESGVDMSAYYPQPVEAFTYDGDLQCMPQNISSLVVYYNKALFRRAGLKHPASWSWEEFRQAALHLSGGDADGLGIEPSIIRVAPFAWSNGGDIVDDLDNPTRFTFDDPASREALEFVISLVRDDKVVPTEEEVASQDLETRFAAGKLGMLLSSRRETPAFREVAGLEWDVAPLPIADEPAGILHSDAYCIAAGSSRADEAFEFVRFATTRQGQTITALGGRTVPSMVEVAESGAFLDPTQEPRHSQVFLDNTDALRRTPVIPTWPEIEDEAEEILTRAFYEPGYTIDDTLRELNEVTADLFAEGSET